MKVDDAVDKRVWKLDSELCKKSLCWIFPKKWFWGSLSIDLKGLDRYCFRDLLRNGTSFDTCKKMDRHGKISRVFDVEVADPLQKKAIRIPRQLADAAGARRGHGLSTITLTLPEKPATSVPAGEEALTSVGSSLHASGQCLVWRGGWVAGLLFSNKHPASVIAKKYRYRSIQRLWNDCTSRRNGSFGPVFHSLKSLNIAALKWMPFQTP